MTDGTGNFLSQTNTIPDVKQGELRHREVRAERMIVLILETTLEFFVPWYSYPFPEMLEYCRKLSRA